MIFLGTVIIGGQITHEERNGKIWSIKHFPNRSRGSHLTAVTLKWLGDFGADEFRNDNIKDKYGLSRVNSGLNFDSRESSSQITSIWAT